MKLFLNSLVIVAAAGIGLAVGFGLRGKTVTKSPKPPAVTAPSSTVPQPRLFGVSHQRTGVRVNDDSPLATQLERNLSMSSGVIRWLFWLESLEKAAPSDFLRLVRLARGNAVAMRLLAERWVELDPRHLFDILVAAQKNESGFPVNELAGVLFREWPKRDPEAVIAALNEPGDLDRRSWGSVAAEIIMETDAERGLRLLSQWHLEGFSPRMTGVARWAALDPRHAAEFTLENPAGHASRYTMETIGKEWAKTDPARALEFAATKPGELGSVLASTTLKEWAGRNLNEAADWLARADARTRNRLSPSFVEAWAKQDAPGALTWCESNLTGSSLAQAVGGVLKGAAEKDVGEAAALVAALNPSPARAEAAVAVAQKWFPQLASGKPVGSETIVWLSGLDPESIKRVLDQVQWGWATSDPKSMAAFLAASSSEHVPTHAYDILAREMARKNPSEALEWTSRLPEERGLDAGGAAFSEWRSSQPDTATKWLNDLPASDARRQPYFQAAIRVLAYDPQATEQFAALTGTDRAAARSVVETMPLPEDRRSRLLDALKPR